MLIVLVVDDGIPHSSVCDLRGGVPAKLNALVVVPAPPCLLTVVFKSFCSVQLVPFHSSVFPTLVSVLPPKIKPSDAGPQPAI